MAKPSTANRSSKATAPSMRLFGRSKRSPASKSCAKTFASAAPPWVETRLGKSTWKSNTRGVRIAASASAPTVSKARSWRCSMRSTASLQTEIRPPNRAGFYAAELERPTFCSLTLRVESIGSRHLNHARLGESSYRKTERPTSPRGRGDCGTQGDQPKQWRCPASRAGSRRH